MPLDPVITKTYNGKFQITQRGDTGVIDDNNMEYYDTEQDAEKGIYPAMINAMRESEKACDEILDYLDSLPAREVIEQP